MQVAEGGKGIEEDKTGTEPDGGGGGVSPTRVSTSHCKARDVDVISRILRDQFHPADRHRL